MEHVQAADEGTLFWFENHHSTTMNQVMKVVTYLGDAKTAIALVLTAVILFYLSGKRRTAVVVLLISVLGLGISQTSKYVIKRERPDVAWRVIDRPHSPSFPSGHSLNSMAIYGTIALLAARHLRRRAARAAVVLVGLILPLAIGISRPYLGVHYPSDVLAGWTAGLACALLALWADQRWGEREPFALSATSSSTSEPLPTSTRASEGIRGTGEAAGFRKPN